MTLVNTQFSSKIPHSAHGQKLIDYLSQRFDYNSTSTWLEHLAAGRVLIQGKVAAPEMVLQRDTHMTYLVVDYDEPYSPAHWETIKITRDFLIVGKPATQPVSRTGKILQNVLVHLLRRHYGQEEISLLHRLDRDTSGIVVLARNKKAAQVQSGGTHPLLQRKLYLAICQGHMQKAQSCSLALRESGQAPVPQKMVPDEQGKSCRTDFWPIAQHGDAQLVLAEIHTGRKHQIRAHLAALGFPILGDKIYGPDPLAYNRWAAGDWSLEDEKNLGASHQLLHAFGALIELPDEHPKWYFSDISSIEFDSKLVQMQGYREKLKEVLGEVCR